MAISSKDNSTHGNFVQGQLDQRQFRQYSLWKFVAENYTEKFDALKFTLKNNIKEDSTENHTEPYLCYSGMHKTINLPHFYLN